MEENDGMEGKVKEKRKKGWKSEEQEREKRETSIYSTGLYLRASLVTLSLSFSSFHSHSHPLLTQSDLDKISKLRNRRRQRIWTNSGGDRSNILVTKTLATEMITKLLMGMATSIRCRLRWLSLVYQFKVYKRHTLTHTVKLLWLPSSRRYI